MIACREEPPRSLRLFMALLTISEVGGCVGLAFGFFAFFWAPPPAAEEPEPFFAAEGAAGDEAGCDDATSVIFSFGLFIISGTLT